MGLKNTGGKGENHRRRKTLKLSAGPCRSSRSRRAPHKKNPPKNCRCCKPWDNFSATHSNSPFQDRFYGLPDFLHQYF